jgi:hypothetical protein
MHPQPPTLCLWFPGRLGETNQTRTPKGVSSFLVKRFVPIIFILLANYLTQSFSLFKQVKALFPELKQNNFLDSLMIIVCELFLYNPGSNIGSGEIMAYF